MNRWAQWARQLRGRHVRVASRAAAPMVFRSLETAAASPVAAPADVHHHHASPRVVFAPRISLAFHQGSRRVEAAPAPVVGAAVPMAGRDRVEWQSSPPELVFRTAPPVDAASLPFSSPRLAPPSRLLSSALVRRIESTLRTFEQTRTRTESSARSSTLIQQVRRAAAREELPPSMLPRIVEPPAPSFAAPASARAQEPAASAAFAAQRLSPVSAPQAPALDVDSLTQRVIQQLDRRLVAYRERMGRI